MAGLRRIHGYPTAALTLIVVAANIFAPFRTSLGRVLLSNLHHGATPRTAIRVRSLTRAVGLPAETAVIALARGDDVVVAPPRLSGTLPPPADSPPARGADRSHTLAPPHLRC